MGFRKAEVFRLKRKNLDYQARGYWLPAAETKGNRDEFVPANPAAWSLLMILHDQALEAGRDALIVHKGQPVQDADKAWNRVRLAAGLEGFVFHNTKAAFVSAVGMAGGSAVAQDLARHKDPKTTARYLKVNDQARRQAVDAAALGVAHKNRTQ
jgi:integrase